MKKMELYPLGTKLSHRPGAFQHVFLRLPRKTVYQVDTGADSPRLESFISIQKFPVCMAAAYLLRRFVMDSLQPQLHRKIYPAGKGGKQLQHLRRQAIGPGGNAKAAYTGNGKGIVIELPQPFHRGIGIGMGLKIGDAARIRPFFPDAAKFPFDLFRRRKEGAFRKFSTALPAIDTPAPAL